MAFKLWEHIEEQRITISLGWCVYYSPISWAHSILNWSSEQAVELVTHAYVLAAVMDLHIHIHIGLTDGSIHL